MRRRAAMIALVLVPLLCWWRPPGYSAPSGSATFVEPIEVDLPEQQRQALARLDREVTIEFDKTPLQQALGTLGRIGGVSFVLDAEAVASQGISPAEPVTASIQKLSIHRAARRLVQGWNLALCLDGAEVLITDTDTAGEQTWTRIYPAADLGLVTVGGQKHFFGREIVEMLEDTLSPDRWHHVGGPGFATYEPVSFSLVVTQSLETHKEVERFLATLRASRQRMVEYCSTNKIDPSAGWKEYLSPERRLEGMADALLELEDGKQSAVLGLTAPVGARQAIPFAARRLAARAMGLALSLEKEIEEEDETLESRPPSRLVQRGKTSRSIRSRDRSTGLAPRAAHARAHADRASSRAVFTNQSAP